MLERFPKRHRLPEVALVSCVLLASVPLSPALGIVGADEAPYQETVVASASAQLPELADDSLSPVTAMALVANERAYLAQQAAQKREAVAAKSLAVAQGNGKKGAEVVERSDTIPVTGVTRKTRQIQSLVRRYFPANQVGNAMAVSACESGHSDAIGATNSDGTTDFGVFQLNDGGTLQGALNATGVSFSSTAEAQKLALNTEINVRAAASIYSDRAWAPWVCAYKIGVVASLYSSAPGPMDGKFDDWGKPTVDVPVINVGPGGSNDRDEVPADPDPEPEPKPDPNPDPGDKPRRPDKPSPDPTRSPEPDEPEPTQSPSPEPSPTRTTAPPTSPPPTRAPAPSAPVSPSRVAPNR